MAELRIPDRHKNGLLKLVGLSDNSIKRLTSAIEGLRPKLFPEDLSVEIAIKVPEVLPDDIIEIIKVLVSLLYSGFHHEIPPEELAHDVIEAMGESGIKELQLPPAKQESLRQRLVKLFTIESLLIVSKALTVLQSNENTFCGARIVTDVRPVFGSDPGIAPNAAVIVHSLNLNYHHDGQLKDFYIAMDTADIKTLRDVLDRADSKTQSLESILKKSGVTYLDPQDRGTK